MKAAIPPPPVRQASLIIMAKAPRAGWCKTRLRPRLGLRGAARVQKQLIHDRLKQALRCGRRVEMHCEPAPFHPAFLAARRHGVRLRRQVSGSLGRRMMRAQARRAVVIIGTDCPSLRTQDLALAVRLVESGQDVCIPATDGGYVLLGLSESCPQVFATIAWGSGKVLRQTLRQHRRLGRPLPCLPPLPDLDTIADYARSRRQGQLPASGFVRY